MVSLKAKYGYDNHDEYFGQLVSGICGNVATKIGDKNFEGNLDHFVTHTCGPGVQCDQIGRNFTSWE
jgi:hypothetical protein